MNTDVPYLMATGNLTKVLDKIQNAGAPPSFNREFLVDLGFTASQDRAIPKLLKFIGLLEANGQPNSHYKEFMDHTKAKGVLATRLRAAYDDLFLSDKFAHTKSAEQLKGWFKTKTGASDAVADKMARTFKTLAGYADFNSSAAPASAPVNPPDVDGKDKGTPGVGGGGHKDAKREQPSSAAFGLVYRFEIHLPDTQNVDTFRAIFRALREELM